VFLNPVYELTVRLLRLSQLVFEYAPALVLQSSDPGDYLGLLQYGVLGAVVIALLTGMLVPKWAHDAVVSQVATVTAKLDHEREQSASMASSLAKALEIITRDEGKKAGRASR
jgi:hypothetical protein